MPYDPVTGEYKEEDSSVANKMTGLLSKDNPYMQQAATRGKQQAQSRGLLNSTMGVSAIESSRLDAALPIATQEAAQTHEANVQGRNIQFQDIGQKRQISADKEMQGLDIASREKMQLGDLAAAKERLGMQLTADEQAALRDIASREKMQGLDIASTERRQANDILAAKERLGMQLTADEQSQLRSIQSQEGMQQTQIAANQAALEAELGSRAALQQGQLAADKEMLGMQLTSQEQRALQDLQAAEARLGLELSSRERMQGADLALQDRLATLNISAQERAAAGNLAQAYEQSYSNMVASIMNNPEMGAADRQRYLNHAASVRDSNLALLEQFYGIDLDWTPAGVSVPNAPAGDPVPGNITQGGLETIARGLRQIM